MVGLQTPPRKILFPTIKVEVIVQELCQAPNVALQKVLNDDMLDDGTGHAHLQLLSQLGKQHHTRIAWIVRWFDASDIQLNV